MMKHTIVCLTLATSAVAALSIAAQGQSYGPESRYRDQSSGYGTYVKGNSADARYCAALIDRYYTYVVSPYDENIKRRYTSTIGVAAAQCEQGNYAGGIPTLEKALTNNRVALPPRG
jgi:hypothetical protein